MLRTDGSLSRTGGKYPIYFGHGQLDRPRACGSQSRERIGRGWTGKPSAEPPRASRASRTSLGAPGKAVGEGGSGRSTRQWPASAHGQIRRARLREIQSRACSNALAHYPGRRLADRADDVRISAPSSTDFELPAGNDYDGNCDVEPRHAVRMLERFLKTGEVDWRRAMGRKADGSMTDAEWRKRRMLAKSMMDRFGIEARH